MVYNQSQGFELQQTIVSLSNHLRSISIAAIVFGVISCLTIIGAIFGIPYLIMGIRMKEASHNFRIYHESNNQLDLEYALERLERFFFIAKMMTIIAIIITFLAVLFNIMVLLYFRDFFDMVKPLDDIAMMF